MEKYSQANIAPEKGKWVCPPAAGPTSNLSLLQSHLTQRNLFKLKRQKPDTTESVGFFVKRERGWSVCLLKC